MSLGHVCCGRKKLEGNQLNVFESGWEELCDECGFAHPVLNRAAIKGEDTLRKEIKFINKNIVGLDCI